MGGRKPTLGYPSRTAAVVGLRAQGFSSKQIAHELGIALSTVGALEHSYRRSAKGRADAGQTFEMSQKDVASLRPHAARRGLAVPHLIQQIITTVLNEKLIDAVLDDGVGA